MNKDRLKKKLIKHEGLKLYPYKDTVGKLTIGVGRNLSDRGITVEEALFMLDTDVKLAEREARHVFDNFDELDDVRQEVIVNMLFNLGLTRFLTFKKFIKAVKERDFEKASEEMLDSKWAKQVKNRAIELAYAMKHGRYKDD